MKIETTSVTQSANKLLGTEEKSLYYLVIKNDKGKQMTVNVGKKTHDLVRELVKEEEVVTNLQFEKPKPGTSIN